MCHEVCATFPFEFVFCSLSSFKNVCSSTHLQFDLLQQSDELKGTVLNLRSDNDALRKEISDAEAMNEDLSDRLSKERQSHEKVMENHDKEFTKVTTVRSYHVLVFGCRIFFAICHMPGFCLARVLPLFLVGLGVADLEKCEWAADSSKSNFQNLERNYVVDVSQIL